jgi:CDP-glycerol glycerophosphotransferase (TagB/SpsB family)
MSVLEYRLSALLLRVLGAVFGLLPVRRDRIVLASARLPHLDGNLRLIHDAITRLRPGADVVLLLEPYGYGRAAKLRYLLRVIRGTFHVRTAGLVVVDNAWLPIHVAPHRTATTVVQVWHAAGALKRFGMDTTEPPAEPERTFLHRYYDWVVTAGEASRGPWAAALRTPIERCLPLGSARTDDLFDPARVDAARARALAAYPALAGMRVVLYAPTFRGRGPAKRDGGALDPVRLRALLPATDALVLKSHPNLDPARVPTAGFDVVASPADDMNDLLALADVLVTDYSSSVFEFALLRRPIVLVVPDLEAYERDPGLYLDLRTEVPGALVRDTDAAATAIAAGLVDDAAYDAFIARNMGGCDGHAAQRIVDRFVPARLAAPRGRRPKAG